MTPRNHQLAGSRAVHYGRAFEQIFQNRCHMLGVAVTRIPDGCRVAGRGKLIRVKSDFDWVLTYNRRSAMIDSKTTGKAAFSHSDIDERQVLALCRHEQAGAHAGYVIHLREIDRVIFIGAEWLSWWQGSGRGSISTGTAGAVVLGEGGNFDPTLIFKGEEQ